MNNKVDFDEFTENYNELLKENTKFFSANESYFSKYKIEIVRKAITSPVSRILEYGCGIGRNIPFLKEAFPNATIVGSDISVASLSIASNDYPDVEFFQEGATENTKPFDLIFVAGVFHHIPPAERSAAAALLFERLSPNGRVVIFEHNPFNPVTRKIVNNCPYDEDAILLKPIELKNILKQARLQLERHCYCLFLPPALRGIAKLERYLGWLPLGGQYWVQAKRSS